ncbi:MAG: FKBP-type peptidyl-prolyl cis-trans isomerase [Verrucomicrobia bacterium]|jgi:FKBP-type peptidyl-prolyl cis-trans isomerase|nr:FKBP-type peptidyl-prolyl cis-trans isomerase [Verrucomicrobiota bacterium]|tara:strand:+ start:15272 stop:16102 length:831 start_codon:yes stop_codon:yes gene_type:complete
MRKSLYNSAARISLVALAATGYAIAQDTPKEEPAKEAGTTEAPAADPAATKSDSSYALGYRSGGNFAQEFGRYGVKIEDLEMEVFIKGFTAAVKGDKPEVADEKLQAAMAALGTVLQEREKEAADANLAAGKKFLEENAKREGVTTNDSGLQYEVLEKGGKEKYKEPKKGDPSKQFMVNYKRTLIDGTEFDASPEGSPVPMTLQVIPGLKEAITTMPVGAKWKLFIPSNLAYGAERRSAEIAPNTALIFELELVEIKAAPPAPAGGSFPVPVPQGQ